MLRMHRLFDAMSAWAKAVGHLAGREVSCASAHEVGCGYTRQLHFMLHLDGAVRSPSRLIYPSMDAPFTPGATMRVMPGNA